MSFNVDTSRANAEGWQVFTRSAELSRRSWRRLMLRVMRAVTSTSTTWYKSSFHACSPDTAIPATAFTHSPRFSTSKWSTSSPITKARKRNCSNRLYRFRASRSRAALRMFPSSEWIRFTPSTRSRHGAWSGPGSFSFCIVPGPIGGQFWISSLLQGASGSMTTAISSTTSGGT